MKRRNFLKTQHVRQYQSERYNNPFFRRARKGPKWKLFMLIFLFLAVWGGVIYMLFFSRILYVQTVGIQGLTTIPQNEVEQLVWDHLYDKRYLVFSQQHKLFLNKKALYNKLQSEYNFVTLEISIRQGQVNILAEERITSLVWITNSGWYFIDLDGTTTRELFVQEANIVRERLGHAMAPVENEQELTAALHPTMPIIEDMSKTEVGAATNVITSEAVTGVLEFDKAVRSHVLSPYIYQIEKPGAPWMAVKLESGFEIYFDLQSDLQTQIQTLDIVLEEYNERLAELTYIDLRFGNHVYVK